MFKRKGIVLVTTLAFITVVIMFSVLIAQQGKDTLKSGVGFSDSEQAYLAALSGIEFAKGNLAISKQWGKGAISDSLNDSDNRIKIESGSNWVKGYIGYSSDNNYSAMFSIAFAPNLSDPGVCQYPSCNNINNGAVAANNNNKYHRNIPEDCLYIVCKGSAGKAVKHVEAVLLNAGPSVLSSGTMVCGNINVDGIDVNHLPKGIDKPFDDADKFYGAQPFFSVLRQDRKSKDNVVISSGTLTSFDKKGININQNNISDNISQLLNLSDTNKGSVVMNAGSVHANGRDMMKDPESGLSCNSNSVFDSSDLQEMNSYASATAGISCDSKNNIPSGTYVYVRDCTKDSSGKKNNEGEWRYIPESACVIADNNRGSSSADERNQCIARSKNVAAKLNTNYSDYKAPADTKAIAFGKGNLSGKGKDRTVTVSDNLTAEGNVNFVVVDKVSSSEDGDSSYTYKESSETVDFTIKSRKADNPDADDPVFMCEGNLFIDGEVTGSGKIFAKDNMAFNSGSSLETKAQSGVAVWAGENVDIQPAQSVSNETLETEAGQQALEAALNNVNSTNTTGISNKDIIAQYSEDKTGADTPVTPVVTPSKDPETPRPCFTIEKLTNLQDQWGNGKNDFNNYGVYKMSFGENSSFCYTDAGGIVHTDKEIVFDALRTCCQPTLLMNNAYGDSFYIKVTQGSDTFYYKFSIDEIKGPNSDNNYEDFKITLLKCSDLNGSNGREQMDLSIDASGNGHIYSDGQQCNANVLVDNNNGALSLPFDLNIKSGNGNLNYSFETLPTGNNKPVEQSDANSSNTKTEDEGNEPPPVDNKPTDEQVKEIVNKAIKSKPTKLIGTVYAVKNINIDGGYAEFDILGAIISLTGDLRLENILRASLTYDPDYVPFFKDKGIITNSAFIRVF